MIENAIDYLSNKHPIIIKPTIDLFNSDAKYYAFSEKWYSETIYFLKEYHPDFREHEILDAFAKISFEHIKYQSFLLKNGYYTDLNFNQINEKVYQSKNTMYGYYLPGLRLTFAFWYNHYVIWDYYDKWLSGIKPTSLASEIGIGHGSFFAELLQCNGITADGFDISPHSISWTKNYLQYKNCKNAFKLINKEFRGFTDTYNYIVCGEVLEHISDPLSLLTEIHSALQKNGEAFVTTVINAAAIDHLYLFKNVAEIHLLIERSGLAIKDEIILPLKKGNAIDLEKNQTPINYACILIKAE